MTLLALASCAIVPRDGPPWPEDEGLRALDEASAELELAGSAVGDQLGVALVASGDIGGDGVADIVVGAPGHDPGGASEKGSVFLVSGPITASGAASELGVMFTGEAAGDGFGSALTGTDLDGDGEAEIVIGAPLADTAAADGGEVYVHAGGATAGPVSPGASILRLAGADPSGGFGADVAASEGAILVGANSAGATWAGKALLYAASSSTQPIAEIVGTTASDHLGRGVALGDLDGDGAVDAVVGVTGDDRAADEAGAVYVWLDALSLSGVLGPAEADVALPGTAPLEEAGSFLRVGCELGGDGRADLLVGALQAGVGPGVLYVVSELDGANLDESRVTILGAEPGDASATAGCGADIDGDGADDLVVGAPQADDAGTAWLLPGGPALVGTHVLPEGASARIDGTTATGRFGGTVATSQDLTGDGAPDLLVVAGGADTGEGTVFLFSSYLFGSP